MENLNELYKRNKVPNCIVGGTICMMDINSPERRPAFSKNLKTSSHGARHFKDLSILRSVTFQAGVKWTVTSSLSMFS